MAARGVIDPSKLPPTEDTVYHHILRVYFQVLVWDTLDQFCVDPLEWGWISDERMFTPIKTAIDCAPQDLLKFVRCQCKTGCVTAHCSCKRHGLKCVTACKVCRGDCENGDVSLCLLY